MRSVVLDALILGRGSDLINSVPDRGNHQIGQCLILARKRIACCGIADRRRPYSVGLEAVQRCKQFIQFRVCVFCYFPVAKSIRGDDVSRRNVHLQVLHHE